MNPDDLGAFSLAQLESLRDRYEARKDWQTAGTVRAAIQRRGVVQTEELSRSGQLFAHRVELDPSGLGMRPAIQYTGDPAVWMAPFVQAGVTGRIDAEQCTGANSPEAKAAARETVAVRVRPGETVQVVRTDQ
jgi:hypothetical protein